MPNDTKTDDAKLGLYLLRFRCFSCGTCWLPCHVTPDGYVCGRCAWRFVRLIRLGLAQLQDT